MLATLSSGHHDLSDWLLLFAVIVFAIGVLLSVSTQPNRPAWLSTTTALLLGLALFALSAFVA